ncbi:helix-turn-helix domain-containing protein [Halalkalicoccus salilacus]|uniref:helix-turn-helix domain-containing protein n=1 Tax=Halalkalicoccus salilacus TaxID=3117459 RepID=UPI00300F0589
MVSPGALSGPGGALTDVRLLSREPPLQRIYNVDDGQQGRFGLTERQESTLTAAYEHGCYGVPREVSLSELAEELDVSHQALSERLRRSHRALVENAVIIGEGVDNAGNG